GSGVTLSAAAGSSVTRAGTAGSSVTLAARAGSGVTLSAVRDRRAGTARLAHLAAGPPLPFLPAALVRPGMLMFDEHGGYDLVTEVEYVELDGPVYDLDIESTHNFIANGIVTHNSIYGF